MSSVEEKQKHLTTPTNQSMHKSNLRAERERNTKNRIQMPLAAA